MKLESQFNFYSLSFNTTEEHWHFKRIHLHTIQQRGLLVELSFANQVQHQTYSSLIHPNSSKHYSQSQENATISWTLSHLKATNR